MHKIIFFLIAVLFITNVNANNDNVYKSQENKLEEQAALYNHIKSSASRYLSYRDIPMLLKEYVHGDKALDYGSGVGFSTQFLLEQGYDTEGVDVSSAMVKAARRALPNVKFSLVKNDNIPSKSNRYDLVFSSLVLFEINNEQEMMKYLFEAKRVMKKDGIFLILVGSEHMYFNKNLYTFYNDYPENKHPKSGDLVKVKLPDVDVIFEDYYWSEKDYQKFFKDAGFNVVKTHYPLGKEGEPYDWKDEKKVSPFVIFVMKKE